MRKAEALWNTNADGGANDPDATMGLLQRTRCPISYRALRVVYAKAGTLPAACLLHDRLCVVDHKLYWMRPDNEAEARFLTAILNSETARARVAEYQSRGQWGARDFDKVVFNLAIPRFDETSKLHRALAEAAERAETIAAAVALPEGVKFQRARGLVRAALTEAGIAGKIDALVARLLDGG